MDFMGDTGGVLELVILTFSFFLLPISNHSFVLDAAKNIFLARTRELDIFEKVDDASKEDEKMSKYIHDHNHHHHQ